MMLAKGRVVNGVVVLEEGTSLPEGTIVTIVPDQPAATAGGDDDLMSEEEHRRIVETMDRIAALPDENPGDTFSGADHDKVLYGKP